MAYRLGAGSWIGVGEETTFGTAVAPTYFYKNRPGDEDLSLVHEVVEVDQLESGRGIYLESQQKGFRRVEGSLNQALRYDSRILSLFLKHLLQEDSADSGASDPYTHTWDFAADSASSIVGLTIASYRDGDIGSKASDDARQFTGCQPTAAEFNFDENSVISANWTIEGKDAAWASLSAITPSFDTDSFIKLPSEKTSPTSLVRVDWNRSDPDSPSYSDVKCRGGSLRIEQSKENTGSLESATASGYRYNDRLMITGSLELEFQGSGTTGDDISKAYVNQELAAISITIDGPTANESLVFNLHSCLATSSGEPHADEIGTIYQTLEFRAIRDASATSTSEGTIVLTNGNATA